MRGNRVTLGIGYTGLANAITALAAEDFIRGYRILKSKFKYKEIPETIGEFDRTPEKLQCLTYHYNMIKQYYDAKKYLEEDPYGTITEIGSDEFIELLIIQEGRKNRC